MLGRLEGGQICVASLVVSSRMSDAREWLERAADRKRIIDIEEAKLNMRLASALLLSCFEGAANLEKAKGDATWRAAFDAVIIPRPLKPTADTRIVPTPASINCAWSSLQWSDSSSPDSSWAHSSKQWSSGSWHSSWTDSASQWSRGSWRSWSHQPGGSWTPSSSRWK